MPRYRVSGHVTVSAYTFVEAADEKAARRIASDREAILAQYGVGRSGESAWENVIVENADGDLMVTAVEETDEVSDLEDEDDDV